MTYITDFIYAAEADPRFINLLSDPNRPRALVSNLANQGNVLVVNGASQSGSAEWVATTDSTAERWKTNTNFTHLFSVDLSASPQIIDCIAFCAHKNLIGKQFTAGIGRNGVTVKTIGPFIITDESPFMSIFEDVEADQVIMTFTSSLGVPFSFEIGVISVGKTVTFPRNLYVGHTPAPYGRNPSVEFMTSDNGQYLGQYRRSTLISNSFSMNNIPPDYYREVLYPAFHVLAEHKPFFFAWRPQKYPKEVGYMWIPSGKIDVNNQLANGYMSMSFSMMGYTSDGQ